MLKSIRPKSAKCQTNRKKQKERPRKSRGKCANQHRFSDTKLGWLIKYEAPILYMLITAAKRMPDQDFIRSIALRHDEPFFKTDEFWIELARYRPKKYWKPSAREELRQIKKRTYSVRAIERILNS